LTKNSDVVLLNYLGFALLKDLGAGDKTYLKDKKTLNFAQILLTDPHLAKLEPMLSRMIDESIAGEICELSCSGMINLIPRTFTWITSFVCFGCLSSGYLAKSKTLCIDI
jgi:hypothetical protein